MALDNPFNRAQPPPGFTQPAAAADAKLSPARSPLNRHCLALQSQAAITAYTGRYLLLSASDLKAWLA
jgi:hypothetical protein